MELLFGIHCHQPVNNFHEVVLEATEKSYLPFLNTLKDYKNIKINIHFSGWLFKWLKQYHKSTFNLLKKLSDNNQVEFFTAGFYEPILAVIPEKDAELQIKKLNKFIIDNFGQTPKGLWLTERVWEDKIIKILVNCGIEYVVVDDYHFFAAGFSEDSLNGYYVTEDSGNKLSIFPISQKLRYLIPFKHIDEIKGFFQNSKFGVLFDDGEKFGLWPKTYNWVYENGWLKEFFYLLDNNQIVNTKLFNEYFLKNKPIGRVYIPEVSYYEMGEWSYTTEYIEEIDNFKNRFKLTDREKKYLRGGIWKNFLIKYEEANNIQKKIIYVSERIKNKAVNDKATDFLLQAQCNDCLWHGIFGGIYLPNLRDNAYIALNKAENIIGTEENAEVCDINKDGFTELILKNGKISATISSKFSGALYEFSDRLSCFNILNTLTRRKEFYHNDILNPKSKSNNVEKVATIHEIDFEITEEIKKHIVFDRYLKYSFIDIFAANGITLLDYKMNKFQIISDFHKKSYNLKEKQTFYCNGSITLFNKNFPIYVEKKYSLDNSYLNVEISSFNNSFLYFDILHIVELNFFFPGHNSKRSFIEINNKIFKINEDFESNIVTEFKIFDEVIKGTLIVKSNKDFRLFSFPFYSVSKSEKAYDTIYQGSTFALIFPFDSKYGESKNFKITLGIEHEEN